MSAQGMPIIDENGLYAYVPGTPIVQTSTHPVYRARIELALTVGSWIGDPAAGSNLGRFKRVRASSHQIDEFEKELAFYLQNYDPTVIDELISQGAVQTDLSIAEDALDVVVSNTS